VDGGPTALITSFIRGGGTRKHPHYKTVEEKIRGKNNRRGILVGFRLEGRGGNAVGVGKLGKQEVAKFSGVAIFTVGDRVRGDQTKER